MSAIARRFLLPLSVLALSFAAQGAAADSSSAAPESTSDAMLVELDRRLDALQGLLNGVRDARGEVHRQAAMERHWQAMQDYMAASLKLAVDEDGTGQGGSTDDCRVVSGQWTGLSFPGHVLSDDYLKTMQAQMSRMREDLIGLRAAQDTDALNAALRTHWQANYQVLQSMRGLDWMFGAPAPAAPGDQSLPDPKSEGAQLTQTYCSICHAIPNARLHTAEEWTSVMATMTRHVTSSDSGFPMCVQVPTAAELEAIRGYLVKYAR